MIVDLMRAFVPEEIGREEEFITGSVLASAATWDRVDVGNLCPACVEMLARRKPEQFPTREEYEELCRRYPGPMFASVEEVMRLERANSPRMDEAYEARYVFKGPL